MTNLESILKTHGLDELIPMFESQGIDDSVLGGLTDSDLALIGVSKLGDRKKLLNAFSGKTTVRDTPNLAALPKKKTFWYTMGLNSYLVVMAAFTAWFIVDTYRSWQPITGGGESTVGKLLKVTVPPPRSTPSYAVTAEDLFSEYKDNEIAADNKYKKKIVSVSGVIQHIGKDIMNEAYIVIGGRGFLDGVQCFFPRSAETELGSLSVGRRVTIKGEVGGKMGNVLIRNCTIESLGGTSTVSPSTDAHATGNPRNPVNNSWNPLNNAVEELENSGAPPSVIDSIKQVREALNRGLPTR